MNGSIELQAYKLILGASVFTKIIIFVLFVISVISWAIMIHKYFTLNRFLSRIAQFSKSLTNQSDMAYIEDRCAHFSNGPAKRMPIVMIKLIRAKRQGQLAVDPLSILNTAVMHESNSLQKGMGMLATAANVSPLIGLLGTVWGVMYSFLSVGLQGSANIAVVAPGIAEALITTIAGLLVAIPAMAGHGFLSVWINSALDYLDRITEYAHSVLREK